MRIKILLAAAILSCAVAQAVESQVVNGSPPARPMPTLPISRSEPPSSRTSGCGAPSGSTPKLAPNVPAGHRRFLIEADVVALIRGAGGIDARVSYVVDLPADSRPRRGAANGW